jgi:hypothetical protein
MLQRLGFPFSRIALSFGDVTVDSDALAKSQSVYFFTLVIMQWG